MNARHRTEHRRKTDRADWERQVEALAQQLCSPQEWAAYRARHETLRARYGHDRIRLFPVWRRYREQAQRMARLCRALPILKALPCRVLAVLSRWLWV